MPPGHVQGGDWLVHWMDSITGMTRASPMRKGGRASVPCAWPSATRDLGGTRIGTMTRRQQIHVIMVKHLLKTSLVWIRLGIFSG